MQNKMKTNTRLSKLAGVALLWVVSISWTASAATYSLSGNWSNTTNPNGPWSYNQGGTPLPQVTDWTGAGTALVGCNQPAWAPSNNEGNFLPALMKANSCAANYFVTHSSPGNVMPGDIVTHTVDGFNGNPAKGVANFLFTLPAGANGNYEISGFVWDAFFDTSRPQDWKLLVNGVEEASGSLSGSVSRSQAEAFNIFADLTAGDTVDLQLFMDPSSCCGFFVGTNMTIMPAPIFTTLVSFDGTNGSFPIFGPLVQGFDGNLYGTAGGGAHNDGVLFKVTPGGALTSPLHSFDGTDGAGLNAGLVLTANGNFYGTTQGGGASTNCSGGCGTIFKFVLNLQGTGGTLTTLHSFNDSDGSNPSGGLVQGADGNFYGVTNAGGASGNCSGGCGTIFRFALNPQGTGGTLTTLHSFDGSDGSEPIAGLVQATDGNFYGITFTGGAHNDGAVFKMTPPPTATVTVLHNFDGTDGANSYGSLIQATNGILYGMTAFGGANECDNHGNLVGCGTIFKITLAGALTTVHDFDGTDGAFPSVPLIQATDGNFYGTTYQKGGTNGFGTIFKFTPGSTSGGTLTTLHTFGAPTDPNALLQATNGEFYGTTIFGGTNNDGTVFSLSVRLGPFVKTLPTSGKVGTSVIILGNNLTGSTKVTFNGTAATFKVVSSTEIKATVPSGATTGKVKVTTRSRTLSSNVNFRVTP